MTYTEFVENWKNNILPSKETFIREGQSLMNYLGEIWIEEYRRITIGSYNKSNINCFYNDRIVENTLNHLKENWEKYPS